MRFDPKPQQIEPIRFKQEEQQISHENNHSATQSNRYGSFQSKAQQKEGILNCGLKKKSYISVTISVLLFIFLYILWTAFSDNQNPHHSLNDYINSQLSIQDQINSENRQQLQNGEDDFKVNRVQTQFQGKQTEESLARAAFLQMQKKFNIAHTPGHYSESSQRQRKKLLQDIQSLEVMIPDESFDGYVAENFYFFSASIHDMIMNSNLYLLYRDGQTVFKISLKQHMRAIIRTQLVHNVNYKGQIHVQMSPFDKGKQQKQRAIRQIMDDEELYYQSFYQLSKYNNHQLRFCILVPSYKNVKSRLYLRNLDSIFMQDYQNYHVVYIDDASPDLTGDHVKKYVEEKGIPDDKIQVFINDQNMKAMYNIYNGIHSYCPDGQVVGLIDGDDSLLGRKVLQLYNAVYQAKRPALIYSNFLKILTNNVTSFGFGTELTQKLFESGILRNSMQLMGSHFMTFFSDLFKLIKRQDLCYENGTFYDYAYDRAIITPMIEMAFPRVQYLAQITYQYRNDTGINDGTEDWERVSKIILNNKAYKKLNNFSFIDDFVQETERLWKKEKKDIKPKENKPFIEEDEKVDSEEAKKLEQSRIQQ